MAIPKRLTSHVIALAAALLLTGCTGSYRPYRVAGNSMSPLLREGQRIFVDESATAIADLHDGDVIVFRRPDKAIITKRILAMPGETISGTNRKVFRNGKQLDEPYLAPPSTENIPELVTFPARTIPAGELFVMGDNRDLSFDSRAAGYGPVHLTDVVGKYSLTYWPAPSSK